MRKEDRIFWDRIEDMPAWEAEQECVLRRENNTLEMVVLQQAIAEIVARTGKRTKEAVAIGVEMASINAQNTRLNERIKYLRKLQAKIQWREAVQALFGDEAVCECAVWIEQQYAAERAAA